MGQSGPANPVDALTQLRFHVLGFNPLISLNLCEAQFNGSSHAGSLEFLTQTNPSHLNKIATSTAPPTPGTRPALRLRTHRSSLRTPGALSGKSRRRFPCIGEIR